MQMKNTAQLLVECAEVINRYGPDSERVEQFIQEHSNDQEFVELAELSRKLKRKIKEGIVSR